MARNTGIFWVMFQGAGLVGNTVSYFQFGDSHDIDPNTRNVFVTVLLVVSCAGALVHCFTLPMPWTSTIEGDKPDTVVTAITRSAKLFSTRPMLQLMVYFIFHGMEYAFWTGVYGPCLGFTLNFYKSRRLPGLHGIIDATGQIIAGLMCIFFGTRIIQRHGRWPVVLLGLLCLFSAYILIFFNLPKEAPFGDTEAPAIIEPSSVGIALFCSLLLGFGSGCLATQTIALVGTIYQDQSAQGYVSYKFLSHGGIAIGFAYAGFLNLYWQLGILWAMGTLGFLLFYLTEAEYRREHMDSLQEDGWLFKKSETVEHERREESYKACILTRNEKLYLLIRVEHDQEHRHFNSVCVVPLAATSPHT